MSSEKEKPNNNNPQDNASAIAAAIKPLEDKNAELAKQNADMAEKLKQWDGLNASDVKTMLSRIENDEDAKLIKEGKITDVIGRHTQKIHEDYQTKLEAAKKINDEASEKLSKSEAKLRDTILQTAIKDAAVQGKVLPSAIDDVLSRGKSVFSTDDDGNIIARDKDGKLIMSKDGLKGIDVKEWVSGLLDTAPHLFHSSSGAGLNGAGPDKKNSFTLTKSEAKNVVKYNAAKKAALEAGQQITIIED